MSDFDIEDLEDMARFAMASAGVVRVSSIVKELPNIRRLLEPLDPIETAAAVGGLLTAPEIQSNCLRLEALIHLAICFCRGQRKPSGQQIGQLFGILGEGVTGRYEDPAEDVFVSSIYTPRGNFRVLEGIWESAGFFLQRVVNVVNGMPDDEGYNELRESVYGLLKLSDAVCERAGLTRYQLGNEMPENTLPKRFTGSVTRMQDRISFSEDDLRSLGIAPIHLADYTFDKQWRGLLLEENIGHSSLEKHPIIVSGSHYYLVLPTAVSAAIRRLVIKSISDVGLKESFLKALAKEYSACLGFTPIMLDATREIRFGRTENGIISGLMFEADKGRYISLAFYLDSLEDFESGGLVGFNPDPDNLAEELRSWSEKSSAQAEADSNFKEGIFLLVGCGIGRGSMLDLDGLVKDRWHIKAISAPDFVTLSWAPKFKALSLFRFLSSVEKLEEMGVRLQNINGLLNLVAWANSLDGHLVPHGEIPDEFIVEGGISTVAIQQNCLRDLRHEVLSTWDPHVEQYIDGKWLFVQKEGRSFFEEDSRQPTFVAIDRDNPGPPRSVYVTKSRVWWFLAHAAPQQVPKGVVYERWKMLAVWAQRAAPIIEERIAGIPAGPLLCEVIFTSQFSNTPIIERLSLAEALADIEIMADHEEKTIKITVGDGFEKAIFNEENIAERALIISLVKGVSFLAQKLISEENAAAIAASIVASPLARQLHAFRARSFRDYVSDSVTMDPLLIDLNDDAMHRLNLGWRTRTRAEGNWIDGKQECVDFLNNTVNSIEDDICTNLKKFNRREALCLLLENHESIVLDRERWRRTSAAVISLRDNEDSVRAVISEHESKLNAASLASRILIEMAICECPLEGGASPGTIDISRLLARVALLYQLGGWSDAIRWDAMEPRIKVTALGDIHTNHDFMDDILQPFANVTNNARIDSDIESYDENLEERSAVDSVHDHLEANFLSAWLEETGATVDEARIFVDFIEDVGIDKGRLVFEIPRSMISKNVSVGGKCISDEAAEKLASFLTLQPRDSWRSVPDGFDKRDINPWRFRRRLTILRKPLVQLDDKEDPTVIIAPGIVRDSLIYMLRNYYRGDFPTWQIRKLMNKWSGQAADERGKKFTTAVADALTKMGWQVSCEVKVTKLLKKGFEKDYGDVDVLAWNEASGRILIIECKDVQFRKTFGEIAEQLSDFRGEIRPDGKPDYLLRHLERVNLIKRHSQELLKFISWMDVCDFKIESHLVFKNPVPMKFALENMSERVRVHFFDQLEDIMPSAV